MRRAAALILSCAASCGDAEVTPSGDLGPPDRGGPDREDTDGNVLPDASVDEFLSPLVVEAGEDFIARFAGPCFELGPEEEIPGAHYEWQIVETPSGGSSAAELFNRGEAPRNLGCGLTCGCTCPKGSNARPRACFCPDHNGVYTFVLTISRGKEQVQGEVRVLVPAVLNIVLTWLPGADLNLHLRRQGEAWGSADGDASLHNRLSGVPDWGEARPASGRVCDPSDAREACVCDETVQLFRLCIAKRCEEIADDPIYTFDDFDGTLGGEQIILTRPPAGSFEVGVDNQSGTVHQAWVIVEWLDQVLYDSGWFNVPFSTKKEPVTLVGVLNVPVGQEGWWAGATFEEAAP